MKKSILTSMLLMLITFLVFIGPSEKIAQMSLHTAEETTISAVDTIADADVITESVQTVIQKSQPDILFPSTDYTRILTGTFLPLKRMNHAFFSNEMAGFILVVQHQSNYLPLQF